MHQVVKQRKTFHEIKSNWQGDLRTHLRTTNHAFASFSGSEFQCVQSVKELTGIPAAVEIPNWSRAVTTSTSISHISLNSSLLFTFPTTDSLPHTQEHTHPHGNDIGVDIRCLIHTSTSPPITLSLSLSLSLTHTHTHTFSFFFHFYIVASATPTLTSTTATSTNPATLLATLWNRKRSIPHPPPQEGRTECSQRWFMTGFTQCPSNQENIQGQETGPEIICCVGAGIHISDPSYVQQLPSSHTQN